MRQHDTGKTNHQASREDVCNLNFELPDSRYIVYPLYDLFFAQVVLTLPRFKYASQLAHLTVASVFYPNGRNIVTGRPDAREVYGFKMERRNLKFTSSMMYRIRK